MSSGFGLLTPAGGIKLGNAALGLFGLNSVTRLGANLLALDGAVLTTGIDRTYTKGTTTVASTLIHLFGFKSSVTLGWMFGEWVDFAGILVDKLTINVAQALTPALPEAPATKGIVGRRFEFESGGVMGRRFGYESGGVVGDKFGYNSGQVDPAMRETLERLKAQVQEGGNVSAPTHVTVHSR
jgi:hypothetical protein